MTRVKAGILRCCFILWLCNLSGVSISVVGQTGHSDKNIEILYTSKLLGYIREDGRTDVMTAFRKTMTAARARSEAILVVGMGDNLAPEYGARVLASSGKMPASYKSRQELDPALGDNVVKELVNNQYDVIVPGKEDFYFGAERLRQIGITYGIFNAGNIAETPSYPAVKHDANESSPEGYLDSHPHIKPFDDGHLVLKRNGRKPTYSISFEKSELKQPAAKPPDLQLCYADGRSHCPYTISGAILKSSENDFQVATYDLSVVKLADAPSGSRRLICFNEISQPKTVSERDWRYHGKRYCHAVTIDETMFKSFPYSSITKPGIRFAVFPVAAPNLKFSLSRINRQWIEPNNANTRAEIAIWDPESAIRQAYYECVLNKECDDSTEIVVLAQMTRSEARQLVSDLDDVTPVVVLSKAEGIGSPFGTDMDFSSAGEEVPVIGTRPIFFPDDKCDPKASLEATLRNPIHLISIDPGRHTVSHYKAPFPDPADPERSWCLVRPVSPRPSKKKPAEFPLDLQVRNLPWRAPDLEYFVADQMRDRFGGDVGLITPHEIFRDKELTEQEKAGAPAPLAEQTERAIWEGARVTKVRLSGKELRAALDASNDAEPDRQLVHAGVVPNDNKDYYVNGKPLLDGSYYTVIAPSALIYGEPTYKTLASETFASPEVSETTVAKFVCDVINEGLRLQQQCAHVNANIAAHNTLAVWEPPRSVEPVKYFLSIVAPDRHDPLLTLVQGSDCTDQQPCTERIEKQTQGRRIAFAKLQKNALSYALSKPNTSDTQLASNFAGVTDTRVVQAHTEAYSVDHNMRLGFAWRHAAAGVEETIQFGRSRQGDTSGGPDSVSLTSNRGTIGPFFEWSFRSNSAPNWRLIVRPADFSDNFARTNASINGSNGTSFTESIPALRSFTTKGGLRFEAPQRQESLFGDDGNSFIEFGYNSILNRNVPSELSLNPGTTTPVTCSLLSSTFAQCAAGVVAIQKPALITRFVDNRQDGFYWNALFNFPLGKRFTYKISSDGDIRFGEHLSSETLYAIGLDNYLQTRIWGNFGVAPHFGWFFYENQGEFHTLTRRTYDISLIYTFDWHRGLSWRSFFTRPETTK